MKIALTGSNSTGKTTLAKQLLEDSFISPLIKKYIPTDARALLDEMGCHNIDIMSQNQLRKFQISYFNKKKKLENGEDNYITDRSFIDIAAYWAQRDAYNTSKETQNHLIIPCKEEARKYDIHIYLPFGLIKFESDGYRSENIEHHKAIDIQIKSFLEKWNLKYIILETPDIPERIRLVRDAIRDFS